MIPYAIAPLKDVTVLVTRPSAQCEALCALIASKGGEAIAFPAIAIEQVEVKSQPAESDWIVFISKNAVDFGSAHIARTEKTRFAAIGKGTAAALKSHDITPDAVPDGFTSEALLAHPAFATISGQSVLIVKGEGGREHLADTLHQRGAKVTTFDVYRRVQPAVDHVKVQELESHWHDGKIDIVTLTSVETAANLFVMLTERGRSLLRRTPFVTLSERIVTAARELGMIGEAIMSRGADDEALVGAIAAWHARAR